MDHLWVLKIINYIHVGRSSRIIFVNLRCTGNFYMTLVVFEMLRIEEELCCLLSIGPRWVHNPKYMYPTTCLKYLKSITYSLILEWLVSSVVLWYMCVWHENEFRTCFVLENVLWFWKSDIGPSLLVNCMWDGLRESMWFILHVKGENPCRSIQYPGLKQKLHDGLSNPIPWKT